VARDLTISSKDILELEVGPFVV
jgi:hypothetical protein